ncbi:MAG: thiamine pyrophosphate-binding protein [Chloroflexi bacterium]|nr:thiamine pyrophosphate-binding protein [Chloroflexota bacterium]
MRGADLLVKALTDAGVTKVFALSGNQIMSVFDAGIGTELQLIHTRHEAAAVHMADAWGRLTGRPGVALITAGPGLANALSALYVARLAESPLVLLSGHTPVSQLGLGAFQEMPQAELAAHVTKASWMASDGAQLGHDIERAMAIAVSGRPGPVQVSLPADVLESEILGDSADPISETLDSLSPVLLLSENAIGQLADALTNARKPLVLGGPAMSRGRSLEALQAFSDATGVPAIAMESPRGVNDPSLGAFAEVLVQADLILLMGKRLDFMVQFGSGPDINPDAVFMHVDADEDAVAHSRTRLEALGRATAVQLGDPVDALKRLAAAVNASSRGWRDEVSQAVAYRPAQWREIESASGEPLHAVEICRAVQGYLDGSADSIYVSDGGEFGQWAQACLSTSRRVINGPAGSIGSSIPLAIGARAAYPDARIVTMLGDGTFGFHPAEFDTAVRNNLPFIAVVGNDSTWNAEYQIQLRDYGSARLVGCELSPATRYDEVVTALGGFGELVTEASELGPALQRAHNSGLPACINVIMARNAAPLIRRED